MLSDKHHFDGAPGSSLTSTKLSINSEEEQDCTARALLSDSILIQLRIYYIKRNALIFVLYMGNINNIIFCIY